MRVAQDGHDGVVHHDFDPYRDTDTSTGEDVDDPFEDWPTRSLNDPIGEIQGFRRFARALTNERGRLVDSRTMRVGAAIATCLFVLLIVSQVLPLI